MTLSLNAHIRKNGLPKVGETLTVKEIKLFENSTFQATVKSVEKEDVNNSGNIRYNIETDKGVADVWEHEIN